MAVEDAEEKLPLALAPAQAAPAQVPKLALKGLETRDEMRPPLPPGSHSARSGGTSSRSQAAELLLAEPSESKEAIFQMMRSQGMSHRIQATSVSWYKGKAGLLGWACRNLRRRVLQLEDENAELQVGCHRCLCLLAALIKQKACR